MRPEPVLVWEFVVDTLLSWRHKDISVKNGHIDHALRSIQELRKTAPAPSEIRPSDSNGVKLLWRSELQDMTATYDDDGEDIGYIMVDNRPDDGRP